MLLRELALRRFFQTEFSPEKDVRECEKGGDAKENADVEPPSANDRARSRERGRLTYNSKTPTTTLPVADEQAPTSLAHSAGECRRMWSAIAAKPASQKIEVMLSNTSMACGWARFGK
jgi:hypothetical protein